MKIHSNIGRILFFLIIVIFCALPPLFSETSADFVFSQWQFPLRQICCACFAFVIIFLQRDEYKFMVTPIKKQLIYTGVSFLCLVTISTIILLISTALGNEASYTILKPDNFISIIFCLLNFLCMAFYEETIYRFFIPDTLYKILCKNKKVALFVSEFMGILLFSIAHIYLGKFSVINAASAYIILRFCRIKTNGIIAGTAAHFFYNLFELFISPF